MSPTNVGDLISLPEGSSSTPALAALVSARGKEAVLVFFFRAFT